MSGYFFSELPAAGVRALIKQCRRYLVLSETVYSGLLSPDV